MLVMLALACSLLCLIGERGMEASTAAIAAAPPALRLGPPDLASSLSSPSPRSPTGWEWGGATGSPPHPHRHFTKPTAALTPPMGWMSWNHFRCGTNATSPDAISEALVASTAAGLISGGFAGAGFTILAVDDCWQDVERDAVTGAVRADRTRFPSGLAGLGRLIHSYPGLAFGLYGDVGPRTCGGFPGNGGHFAADAAAMAAAGVDFFKADGCNAEAEDLPALYQALAAELAKATAARPGAGAPAPITLSCSWPAYLPDARAVHAAAATSHPLPPIPYHALRQSCHAWRNWNDVDTSAPSLAAIARYWAFAARFSPHFASTPRPGAWHDPDELLVGEPRIPYTWQALQFALWSAWGAPLFLSADVRGGGAAWLPSSRALALHAELIAVNQRGSGPARLVACVGGGGGAAAAAAPPECALQAWARPVQGGAVAVVAANLGGTASPRRRVCVPVRRILEAAGRVWGEEGEGGGGTAPSLCWRPISLEPRTTPLSTFRAWTDEDGFPHTTGSDARLCLEVVEAGAAAAVVGRPCERRRGGQGWVGASRV